MKKLLVIGLAVLIATVFTGTAMASTEGTIVLEIGVRVDPWVEVHPCIKPMELRLPPLEQEKVGYAERVQEWFPGSGAVEDFYANLPVTQTLAGSNCAGDDVPVFAREELEIDGTGKGRYDRLGTHVEVLTYVNAFQSDPNYWSHWAGYNSNTGWFNNPMVVPTPHDGEVWEKLFVKAWRIYGPDWNTDNTYDQSHDAGWYWLRFTKTLVANTTTAQTPDL